MTTDSTPQKKFAANLFEANDVLNLVTPQGLSGPISAVSFVAPRPSINVPWNDVLSSAIDMAMSFISTSPLCERRWLFFGATAMWKTPNAITRHKKFWSANNLINRSSNASPEVELTYDSMVRYAVSAEINHEGVPVFGKWIRSTQCGLMFLKTSIAEQTEADVQHYFANVFTNNKSDIDWSRAVGEFCKFDSVLVRFSGSFDDPDAAVDLIYNPGLVDLT